MQKHWAASNNLANEPQVKKLIAGEDFKNNKLKACFYSLSSGCIHVLVSNGEPSTGGKPDSAKYISLDKLFHNAKFQETGALPKIEEIQCDQAASIEEGSATVMSLLEKIAQERKEDFQNRTRIFEPVKTDTLPPKNKQPQASGPATNATPEKKSPPPVAAKPVQKSGNVSTSKSTENLADKSSSTERKSPPPVKAKPVQKSETVSTSKSTENLADKKSSKQKAEKPPIPTNPKPAVPPKKNEGSQTTTTPPTVPVRTTSSSPINSSPEESPVGSRAGSRENLTLPTATELANAKAFGNVIEQARALEKKLNGGSADDQTSDNEVFYDASNRTLGSDTLATLDELEKTLDEAKEQLTQHTDELEKTLDEAKKQFTQHKAHGKPQSDRPVLHIPLPPPGLPPEDSLSLPPLAANLPPLMPYKSSQTGQSESTDGEITTESRGVITTGYSQVESTGDDQNDDGYMEVTSDMRRNILAASTKNEADEKEANVGPYAISRAFADKTFAEKSRTTESPTTEIPHTITASGAEYALTTNGIPSHPSTPVTSTQEDATDDDNAALTPPWAPATPDVAVRSKPTPPPSPASSTHSDHIPIDSNTPEYEPAGYEVPDEEVHSASAKLTKAEKRMLDLNSRIKVLQADKDRLMASRNEVKVEAYGNYREALKQCDENIRRVNQSPDPLNPWSLEILADDRTVKAKHIPNLPKVNWEANTYIEDSAANLKHLNDVYAQQAELLETLTASYRQTKEAYEKLKKNLPAKIKASLKLVTMKSAAVDKNASAEDRERAAIADISAALSALSASMEHLQKKVGPLDAEDQLTLVNLTKQVGRLSATLTQIKSKNELKQQRDEKLALVTGFKREVVDPLHEAIANQRGYEKKFAEYEAALGNVSRNLEAKMREREYINKTKSEATGWSMFSSRGKRSGKQLTKTTSLMDIKSSVDEEEGSASTGKKGLANSKKFGGSVSSLNRADDNKLINIFQGFAGLFKRKRGDKPTQEIPPKLDVQTPPTPNAEEPGTPTHNAPTLEPSTDNKGRLYDVPLKLHDIEPDEEFDGSNVKPAAADSTVVSKKKQKKKKKVDSDRSSGIPLFTRFRQMLSGGDKKSQATPNLFRDNDGMIVPRYDDQLEASMPPEHNMNDYYDFKVKDSTFSDNPEVHTRPRLVTLQTERRFGPSETQYADLEVSRPTARSDRLRMSDLHTVQYAEVEERSRSKGPSASSHYAPIAETYMEQGDGYVHGLPPSQYATIDPQQNLSPRLGARKFYVRSYRGQRWTP